MTQFPREEIEATHDRYLRTREAIMAGELKWDALAQFFTEDATFIDPAWGRMKGIANMREFFTKSMSGLEDWHFPHDWRVIDGNRLVGAWKNRLPGQRPDGTYYEAQGLSVMIYAGGGKFSYEEDLLNMVHIFQLIAESGWKPNPRVNMPPQRPPR
jgi:ketosteroid isomerase-like protein